MMNGEVEGSQLLSHRVSMRLRHSLAALIGSLSAAHAHAAVLWMDQAQRLQEVSASLLDTMPVPRPLPSLMHLGIRSDLSFLPSPNPRVGAKLEQLPSSPVQSIPAVFAGAGILLSERESVSMEAWAGVLPAGVEKLFGIEASLLQYQWGARAQLASARFGSTRWSAGAGLAQTKSKVSGKISSASGGDSFTSDHTMKFVEGSIQHLPSGSWLGVMFGDKRTVSRLAIQEDATDLILTDTLSQAGQPYWSQYTVGVATNSGLAIALSELIVPSRLEMPRVTVSWQFLSR
ncbi:MAG: hypothetical protein RIR26_286 [Pseudomonadota bacterium]|jgi:hypothetical protein